MGGRSVSFYLAVLLAACGLLIADDIGDVGNAADGLSLMKDPRCSPSFSVILSLENSSFFYNGIVYPAELRWTDGNVTYGCICRLRNCIRKCCRNDEVLREKKNNYEICQKMPQNDTELMTETPHLRLSRKQMTEEIQHIENLKNLFHLVQDNTCPPGRVYYALNPDNYGDEKIILQANGSFVDTDGKIFPFWNYCIDWKVTVNRIGILVCWTPENEANVDFHYHVGIIVSIPFLIATFLVYAITPELRNLYGKTLMCYVICLIIAYVFLILANYIYMIPIRPLCFSTALFIVFHVILIAAATFESDQTEEEPEESKWKENFIVPHVYLEKTTGIDGNSSGKPRVSLCCRVGTFLNGDNCVEATMNGTEAVQLPLIYEMDLISANVTASEKYFDFVIWNPCAGMERYSLNPRVYKDDEWYLLSNGTIILPLSEEPEESLLDHYHYCLARVESYEYPEYMVFFCDEVIEDDNGGIIYSFGMLASVPFLVVTYVVYWLLPELRNLHGRTLRGYVGCLAMAYSILGMLQLTPQEQIPNGICIAIAFIIHFSFLASFFWLNVMCFDIWWTFGGFRSLQGSVKQRERKKFIIYSIYAWGSASLLSIICAIMDFVPSVPKELIRPEIGVTKCWFKTDEARALYFYGPMGVTVLCNICLFISTALKIVRHKKDTAHHLRGSESRRHDDNKQWFNLYLKLFIVMGINWSMEIISWLITSAPPYVWYLTDLTNTLQGLIIFIIFVWKKKIKRLLLKRFGCQNRDLFSRNSTRSGNHSSASRTCTTTSGVMSLQEKVNPYVQTNCRVKSSSDEADP
ncbi:G-protein coupled receptor Mth2 [Mycetomoellerius zeteki]|uniref:G-protein coupled receptor Mth2 n=1 Tax=Mycetomoellerius zeteki TaxID=64791 RepID=UPI00084E996C|nr:PREDICTED: G-protein coupled receptor Mth2-like [Trachymyrmex zeteki]